MKEFRKYEYGEDVDYVMFCGKSLDEILVSAVSLQGDEWYVFEAVWEMDFLPETGGEFASVLWSHNNDVKGWSCGSWKSVSEINKEEKSKAHDEIIKHFGLM